MIPTAEGLSRRPRAFIAIPCGDYYAVQARVIREVLLAGGIDPYVAEDDPSTKGLWEGIKNRIDSCDLFIADVSSRSPNILFEVGYAVGRKPQERIGVFIADSVDIPSDLSWLILQVYSSLPVFREKLGAWLRDATPVQGIPVAPPREHERDVFTEDFLSEDLFHRRWATPPGCSYLLTSEGLRFSNAHFPILTTPLAILRDCEFSFEGRIEQANIGWAVLGTQGFREILPRFCVMFNLSPEGKVTPHIWSHVQPHALTHYYVFDERSVVAELYRTKDRWMKILTRVRGTTIEIENEGRQLFVADFAEPPFGDIFNSVPKKGGQVGFRCHPREEATVRHVRVRSPM